MQAFYPNNLTSYSLLDSGNGHKLEIFAGYSISRPEPQANWNKQLPTEQWQKAQAIFFETGKWVKNSQPPNPWYYRYKKLCLELKLTPYKHTGVFPEQSVNWDWFSDLISNCGYQPNVLNLFAYTGAATLSAASGGAKVCHVDSSKPAVAWAGKNQQLSNMTDKPIRWIVDDCIKFVEREVKRGVKYDGIIMDPPAFGRDPNGKIFHFDRDVPYLVDLCGKLLSKNPLFLLINAYNVSHSACSIKNLLSNILPINRIECGELHLKQHNSDTTLPCSIFARYY
jgi:23S rRNA (cytosine1962-C5)-methyltransferase